MKTYVGDRTIDGVKVTVDGAPLDPCLNIMEFTKNGFERKRLSHDRDGYCCRCNLS